MNARNFFAEVKRRNVSESRADDLAGGTKQRPPAIGNRSDVRVQNSEVSLVLARSAFGVQCVFASI
jgi:hypothetical protein